MAKRQANGGRTPQERRAIGAFMRKAHSEKRGELVRKFPLQGTVYLRARNAQGRMINVRVSTLKTAQYVRAFCELNNLTH